jgi:hypothetical protein
MLTAANITDEVQVIWGEAPRLFMAGLTIWHSYDHSLGKRSEMNSPDLAYRVSLSRW